MLHLICKKNNGLRVVQIDAILFLKTMSERGGSDIERLVATLKLNFWINSKSIEDVVI